MASCTSPPLLSIACQGCDLFLLPATRADPANLQFDLSCETKLGKPRHGGAKRRAMRVRRVTGSCAVVAGSVALPEKRCEAARLVLSRRPALTWLTTVVKHLDYLRDRYAAFPVRDEGT